jgi:hypothetical protein
MSGQPSPPPLFDQARCLIFSLLLDHLVGMNSSSAREQVRIVYSLGKQATICYAGPYLPAPVSQSVMQKLDRQ